MVDIDTTFDFRTDTPPGPRSDPDAHSPTLAAYHQHLWSKALPDGRPLELCIRLSGREHVLTDTVGTTDNMSFKSDTIHPTYDWDATIRAVRDEVDQDVIAELDHLTHTIGATMLWPPATNGQSINQARGLHRRIRDRFDLTVICVDRHYRNEPHPLSSTFDNYRDYFDLFASFDGWIDFWHLHDMVDTNRQPIEFPPSSNNFTANPIPATDADYTRYATAVIAAIRARNTRITNSQAT